MNYKILFLFCLTQTFGLSFSKEQKTINTSLPKDTAMLKSNDSLTINEFTKTPAGLYYKILNEGTGSKPFAGETVTVHYTGWLLDGNKLGVKFDSSKDRNQKFQFILGKGQVIKGWDLSLADMKIGEKRLVILPPELGYGAYGAGSVIPPHATLVFEIELFGAK